jgi:hypothetical protein
MYASRTGFAYHVHDNGIAYFKILVDWIVIGILLWLHLETMEMKRDNVLDIFIVCF